MSKCMDYVPEDFGIVEKVYILDDENTARSLGISDVDRELRADIYAHNVKCSYLVQECKSRNSLSDAVDQLENTVSTLIENSHQVDRTIIIMDSFGNESRIFKRRKGSKSLYRKMRKRDIPVVVGRKFHVELYLRSELEGQRRD